MEQELKIIVRPLPPSINQYMRWHWAKRRKVFQDIYDQVFWQVKMQKLDGLSDEPVRIEAVRYYVMKMDPDNLAGMMKPVIDGLRYAKVMIDDTDYYVRFDVIQKKVHQRKKARLSVKVHRVERRDW